MEKTRVDRGMSGVDYAAEIGVGAELTALLGARDDMRLDFQACRLRRLRIPRQRFVLGGIVRGVEAATNAEIAVDLFRCDKIRPAGVNSRTAAPFR